ncbi:MULTISPECIES: hypothetical protein [Kitasatospora]|uniref:Uncharacterized protein n=1 Tax=Kitasatospora setae (strain ATCC 33774 / DSM 43861 / JCM 3304 / KCC A-0304 / NBRC 14216 / KM-6054) TaxID=452652 RepID=E4NCY6_KITSK|nr:MULTISPECIES: hypothetical protein [Kitasatospora]BAJ29067.1 hypothetical protein KSE_32580 [Kitasatospora setae KM-6054]
MSLEAEPPDPERIHHRPPTPGTEKALYGTALTCGVPSCGEPLYRRIPDTGKFLLNSRVAHINARSEGGPRWDRTMSEEANRSYENLILMCERHASEIDTTPGRYPQEQLLEWKQRQSEESERAVAALSATNGAGLEGSPAFLSLGELIERLQKMVPSSVSSRSRAEALEIASRESRGRSLVRLRSTPAERKDAVLGWKAGQADPVVEVPDGTLRVLVAPMGAGKSETAERWWDQGLTHAWTDDEVAIPLWWQAGEVGSSLFVRLREALGGDPAGPCRIVLDDLDTLDFQEADRLLDEARRLVLNWPQVSVLATTRPGAGTVSEEERLAVEPWPVQRGLDLLRVVIDDGHIGFGGSETRQFLTSPLQVHALASRLRAGRNAQVSTSELLAGLVDSILERERPDTSAETWDGLARLAVRLLDSRKPVRAASFAAHQLLWKLEDTGLVVRENGFLRFALPLFEQHFGAQALKNGDVRFDAVAGMGRFPRWRYAIAFAVETSTPEAADGHMSLLAQANPAAASWVLGQLMEEETEESFFTEGPETDGPERSKWVAGHLRAAVESWLAGLGDLGPHLELHHGGRIAPWAVAVSGDWMNLGQSYEGALQDDVVALDGPDFWTTNRPKFRTRSGFLLPGGRLGRWRWARDRLRRPLTELVQRRILPVAHSSPLAAERAWYLSQMVMAMTDRKCPTEEVPLGSLRPVVNDLARHVAQTAWSRWNCPGGGEFDSGDVCWLYEHLERLEHEQTESVRNPRPAPDRSHTARNFMWQCYSPELTKEITADALRDALIGYRELVEANFPGYADSFDLYRALPIRIQGTVVMPHPEDTEAWCATVEYHLIQEPAGDQTAPDVQIDVVEEPYDRRLFWMFDSTEDPDRLPLRSTEQVLSTNLVRQATNWAYGWLAADLKAFGWLSDDMLYID